MLRSMTGFGRERLAFDEREILVEIRSVNHRFYEFTARTPRAYGYLDEKLKSLLEKSGFTSIEIHTHADKPWLNVTAKKAD